jgi:metal-sulfur cluster biosynthetic enzyme
MTLTTPACPAADYIPMATKNAIQDVFPEYEISTVMTFEPSWTIEMIKDDDFKKLFSID